MGCRKGQCRKVQPRLRFPCSGPHDGRPRGHGRRRQLPTPNYQLPTTTKLQRPTPNNSQTTTWTEHDPVIKESDELVRIVATVIRKAEGGS